MLVKSITLVFLAFMLNIILASSYKMELVNHDMSPNKELIKISEINNSYNSILYREDLENWNIFDYWASPKEFIEKGGDCEDYAIAKYYALKEKGISIDKLRITYVYSINLNQPHMVLIYKNNDKNLVLDNLTSEIKDWKDRKDLKFIYSFNDNDLWIIKENKEIKAAKANTMQKWRLLQEKVSQEV